MNWNLALLEKKCACRRFRIGAFFAIAFDYKEMRRDESDCVEAPESAAHIHA
jgi:hypothetical protein